MKKLALLTLLLPAFFTSYAYVEIEHPTDLICFDCANPVPGYTSVTANSALLSWDSPGSATSWEVQVIPVGQTFDPLTGTPIVANTNAGFSITSTTQPLFATLLPDTEYVYWVRAICGAGVSSDWIASEPFTTQSTCAHPVNTSVVALSDYYANMQWTPVGDATSWEVIAVPAGSPVPDAETAGIFVSTQNIFNYYGLEAITCYDFYVRSVCSETEKSIWKLCGTACTLISPPVCGGTFTDPAGPNANYALDTNTTVTICPESPGDVVTVTFSEFATMAQWDVMYVYDGSSTSSPQIASDNGAGFGWDASQPGGFWGDQIPGPFESSSADGCLTFYFISAGLGETSYSGWIASVICGPPSECSKPQYVTATMADNTSEILDWWDYYTPVSWEVLALPCGSAPPTANTSGTVATAHPFTYTGLSPYTCYDFYVRAKCSETEVSPWSNPVEAISIPDKRNLVAFVDTNGNGIQDGQETAFGYGYFTVEENSSGVVNNIYSPYGLYQLYDAGYSNTYTLNYVIFPEFTGYYAVSPTSFTNISITEGSGEQTLYFPIMLTQDYNDLSATLIPSTQPIPGLMYKETIVYTNQGISTASGTLTYTTDPNSIISYTTQYGLATNTSGFTFDFTNLQPNETRSFDVYLYTAPIPTLNLGDLVTDSISITGGGTDSDLNNNSFSLTQIAIGAYDPNEISEAHGEKIDINDFGDNTFLYYTIHFQNTGTADALNVRIENTLDSQLDANSLEMVNSNHDYFLERTGNQLTWRFNNIQLPPESENENTSKGYVTYRVKAVPGFAVGDIIPNGADIYFDANPAIVTDTFNTQFIGTLSNAQYTSGNLALYPNPAKSTFTISLRNPGDTLAKISISDVLGKQLELIDANAVTEINVDVSGLAKGIYLVRITTSANQAITKKLVIE